MNIRFATNKDKEQLLRLLDEFSLLLKADDVPSAVGSETFGKVINRTDIKMFVAEEDNKLVGTATLYVLPNIRHGCLRGHIEDFFITQNMRNRGVGTAILNAIKDFCRKNNIRVVKLSSGNELVGAHKFYEKMDGKTTERFFRFDF